MIFSGLFKKHPKKRETADSSILNSKPANENNSLSSIDANSNINDIDAELVAVITAAIQSSYSFDPHSKLIIKSITRTGQNAPIWNRIGRLERINKKFL